MNEELPKLEEMTDILDIKSIDIWQLTWLKYFLIGVGIFVILLCGLWAFFYWRAKKKKQMFYSKPLSSKERAIQRIRKLKSRHLIEKEEYRLFFFELSEIFRDFLEDELSMMAPEATLEELKPLIFSSEYFHKEQKSQSINLLEVCDMAKFAQYRPESKEVDRYLSLCASLIEALYKQHQELMGIADAKENLGATG